MSAKHMREESTFVSSDEEEQFLPPAEAEQFLPTTGTAKPRKQSIARRLSTLLIVLGVLLMLAAGGLYGYRWYRYQEQDRINRELAKHVTVLEVPVVEDKVEEDVCPVEVDWEALKAVNDDVIGWIYVPGTVINYPVYQGVDNDEYLRTNALGEWTVGGQIFLDAENNAPGMIDRQSILYGHHLQDGTMFQPLSLLDDQAVFDATDTIWYLTEKDTFELQPLFMYFVSPEDETVRQFQFASPDDFHAYLREQFARAVTQCSDAEALIDGAVRVLTMSTCNYYDGYGRSILVCIEKQ